MERNTLGSPEAVVRWFFRPETDEAEVERWQRHLTMRDYELLRMYASVVFPPPNHEALAALAARADHRVAPEVAALDADLPLVTDWHALTAEQQAAKQAAFQRFIAGDPHDAVT